MVWKYANSTLNATENFWALKTGSVTPSGKAADPLSQGRSFYGSRLGTGDGGWVAFREEKRTNLYTVFGLINDPL